MARYKLLALVLLAFALAIAARVGSAGATGCTHVADATATANVGAGSTTVSYSPTAGNTLTLSVQMQNQTGCVTITDNKSDTYTADSNSIIGDGQVCRYHSFNLPSGVTSLTWSNNFATGSMILTEFSGGTNTVDKAVGSGGSASTTTTWTTPSSGTLAQASEIVFGDGGESAAGSVTQTVSSGPTNSFTGLNSNAFVNSNFNSVTTNLVGAYLITAATTSVSTGWTVGTSTKYNSLITSYECSGGGAPTSGGFFYFP